MSSNLLIGIASLLTGLGAAAAAIVAAYALRSQQRGQQRQHDLENLRWLSNEYSALRPMRRSAAKGLLDGTLDEYSLREVLNFFESSGFMVRQGFITENTFAQTIGLIAVPGWWDASATVIRNARERVHPGVFEHFEWLKDRLSTGDFEPDPGRIEDFLRREAALPIFGSERAAAPVEPNAL